MSEYDCIFVKSPTPRPSPINKYCLPSGEPSPYILNYWDLAWDGTYWWVLRSRSFTPNTIKLDGVYKFFLNWTYTGISYNLEEINDLAGYQQDEAGYKLEWDGLNWWIRTQYLLYKMYSNFTYTGISYDRAMKGFVLKDSFFWGLESNYVYKYFSEDSIGYNISKFYQGNGYMYMQTNKLEEIGLISPIYDSNYSLSS